MLYRRSAIRHMQHLGVSIAPIASARQQNSTTDGRLLWFCPCSLQIEGFPPNCRHCMWDQVDRDVLMASDGKDLHTYVHSHTTIRGSTVRSPPEAPSLKSTP